MTKRNQLYEDLIFLAERTATIKIGMSKDQNEGQCGWNTMRLERLRGPDHEDGEAFDILFS